MCIAWACVGYKLYSLTGSSCECLGFYVAKTYVAWFGIFLWLRPGWLCMGIYSSEWSRM
jgi:type IV secretory pathway TrbD component